MKQNETKKSQKSQFFLCEKCEYKTDNKKDFIKHTLTQKHLDETLLKQKIPNLICECNKIFNSRTTLWRHKKKCIIEKGEINNEENNINISDKNLIFTLIQQNNELQKQMLEVIKNGTNNITNNTNNSHNKTFNLQVF
jgi:hypothetical protein